MHFIDRLGYRALFLTVLVFFNSNSYATTVTYDLDGKLNGIIKPLDPTKNDEERFTTTITNGVLEYDELKRLLTAKFDFAGDILKVTRGTDVGDISGDVYYAWDNVLSLQLKNITTDLGDDTYLVAITDQNHNNRPARDGQGDGTGRLNLNINRDQSVVVDLSGKAANLAPHGNPSSGYSPVSNYLNRIGENAYVVVGKLNSSETISVHSWFMSDAFRLTQGPGNSGPHVIVADFHGSTEVPEPASCALLGSGVLGFLIRRRRKGLA